MPPSDENLLTMVINAIFKVGYVCGLQEFTTTHPTRSPGGSSVDYFPLMQPWSEDTQQKADLNGDGQITAADAAITPHMAVSGERDDNVDMDGGWRVSSVDALMILQLAAGSIEIS